MRPLLLISLFLLVQSLNAQTDSYKFFFDNIEKKVTRVVQDSMAEWLQKGEFETSQQYATRTSNKDLQVQRFTEKAIGLIMQEHIERINFKNYTVSSYDADAQSYKITLDLAGEFILPVPLANKEAVKFKENQNNLSFSNPNFAIQNNNWILSYIEVISGNKTYTYDITQAAEYNENDYFAVSMSDIEDINISLPNDGSSMPSPNKKNYEDLDQGYVINDNIPITTTKNKDAIAVIIGNRRYQNTKWVNFAENDARIMKEYLIKTLGFREGNIFLEIDATKGTFENYFGTASIYKGKLYSAIKEDVSDVFIFYSGHGAPSVNNKKGYFIPVECDPKRVELSGYSLDLFYNNLIKMQAKSITVVLDACFSGAEVLEDISPIRVKQAQTVVNDSRSMIFSSSSNEEVSSWYNAKKHGLFTYFFLKGIHNLNADRNKDNKLTYAELFSYIANKTEGVPYYARRLHSIDQTPTRFGGRNGEDVFIDLSN